MLEELTSSNRGHTLCFASGHLGGAAGFLADPEVGADRQLLLAAQRPRRVDDWGTADRRPQAGSVGVAEEIKAAVGCATRIPLI
jgi:hypothetical protein